MEKRVLIERWLGPDTHAIPIYDEASVSSARQLVRDAGQRLNLDTELVESVALIASELTHNQLSHAKQGYFAVRPVERQGVIGLEAIAADIGPGIESPALAIKDAIPGGGASLGAGLGAVCRMADEVEFDNRILEGTCVIARKFDRQPAALCWETGIMGRPYPGEVISGDDSVFFQSEAGAIAAVFDGLGHGPEARIASNRAVESLTRHRKMDLHGLLAHLNEDLAGTRGCAMSVVRFSKDDMTLECASLGDVHAHLYTRREAQCFASTPSIVGGNQFPPQKKIRIERATAEPGSIFVMFTDGLKSRTTLKEQLDVLRLPPISIAEHLIDTFSRPDDDVMVLVARFLR